jgi:PAS domain S-box-containing protein
MASMQNAISWLIEFALKSGHIGVCAFDADLKVIARHGALAAWAPLPGECAVENGLLFGMAQALHDLKAPGAAPLVLPSVAVPELIEPRVNIAIAWSPSSQAYVATTTPDAANEQFERLLGQRRREDLMLREQADAAANRLAVSASLYRDIVQSTEDAVIRLTAGLGVTFSNPTAAALFGLAADAAVGLSIRDLAPLPQAAYPWRLDMCATGPASFEQPIRRGDEVVWLWWRVSWLQTDGGLREFQAVGRDVTELKRLRAELDRANELANYAALAEERLRISHDLHDTFVHTLVATLSRLSLLRRAAPEGALKDDILEAERETRAGLRAAREAVGAVRSELDFLDGPSPRLREAAEALRAKMRVVIDIAADLGDIGPMRAATVVRIGREALRNIERHSAAREARVTLKRRGADIVLELVDDGIGFSADMQPEGHFGVAGMREQARFAGGRLEIKTSPGEGTRLTLTISTV